MKKFLPRLICMFLAAFVSTSAQFLATPCAKAAGIDPVFAGTNINGCCSTTQPIASALDFSLLYTAIQAEHALWAEKVVKAIMTGTKAEQAAMSGAGSAQAASSNAQMAAKINAEAQAESVKRNVLEVPVSNCPNQNIGYYFNIGEQMENKALGLMVAEQRNRASGLVEDMTKRDLAIGKLGKIFDKHGFLFPDMIYTEEQQKSAGDAFDLLLPEWKNPRPKNLTPGGQEEARYIIAESRVRILREVMSEAWYDGLVLERAAAIPAKEIYGFVGPNQEYYTTTTYNTNDEGIFNGTTVQTPIGDNDNISRMILFDAPFKHYTNTIIEANIGGLGAAGVLKESLKLQAYMYRVLNEIRQSVQRGNILLSLSLVPEYEKFVDAVEKTIAK